MPIVDGINYTTWGGYADLDFAALGGVYMSPPHASGTGFRLGMIGKQWVFIDPLGKVFISKSFFNVNGDDTHVLGGAIPAAQGGQTGRTQYNNVLNGKYAGSKPAFTARQEAAHRAMHFNAIGPFNFTSAGTSFPVLQHYISISRYLRITAYARAPLPGGFAMADPIKDIARCMPINSPSASEMFYRPTGDSFVGWGDWLDPHYAQQIAIQYGPAKFGIDAKLIAHFFEESDAISKWMGFGHPNERSGALNDAFHRTYLNIHPGIGILFSRLVVTSTTDVTGVNTTFVDTTNYSKAKLIQNLKDKYGTIAALNTAWGTGGYYTSFDSAGGYGVGTGVADEDGLRARVWFGVNSPVERGHESGKNNMVDSTSWGNSWPSPGLGGPNLTNAVKVDLDQIMVESMTAWMKPVWDTLKARDPGILLSPCNNWGWNFRPATVGFWNAYTDLFLGGSLLNIRIQERSGSAALGDQTRAEAIADMNYTYGMIPKPHIVNYYSAPDRRDSCLYYMSGTTAVTGSNTLMGAAEKDCLLNESFSFSTTPSGIYPHIGWMKWEYPDQINEQLHWGVMSLNDNLYDGGDYRAVAQGGPGPKPDPWDPTKTTLTEDFVYSDYLGFGGTNTLQRTDLLVGGNIAIKGVIHSHFGTLLPGGIMATLNTTITLANQDHFVNYTGMRVRFQRSVDAGVTYTDVQSNVRVLGTTTDQYLVPSGQSGRYRAGAVLTDGTNFGTEVFSAPMDVAVFSVLTPQTITLAITA